MLRDAWMWLAAFLVRGVLKCLLFTCKIEIEGVEHLTKAISSGQAVLMLWHQQLLLAPALLVRYGPPHATYTGFVSNSRDAHPLAYLIETYRQGKTIRVRHDAKHQALSEAIKRIKAHEVVVFTPDGPKGPPHVLKPGVVLAARGGKAWIIPFSWQADRYWSFNTWDQIRLPKFFSHIRVKIGDPLPYTAKILDLQMALQSL